MEKSNEELENNEKGGSDLSDADPYMTSGENDSGENKIALATQEHKEKIEKATEKAIQAVDEEAEKRKKEVEEDFAKSVKNDEVESEFQKDLKNIQNMVQKRNNEIDEELKNAGFDD